MIFKVEDGRFGYGKDHDLFKNINFSVNPGEILAILGPNGAGKTTLLKCMMGFLKWREGKSLLNGCEISSMNYMEVWKEISYVPQAKGTTLSMTAFEMVLLGRNSHLGRFKSPAKADEKIVLETMDDLNIGHLASKFCHQISGGQLQMVLIARALVSEPKVLVLDEPESNLDFKNQLIVLETIKKLSKERNIACIFNTHYPSHALSVSDNALLLDKSGKSIFGPSSMVIDEKNMQEVFGVKVVLDEKHMDGAVFKTVIPISIP